MKIENHKDVKALNKLLNKELTPAEDMYESVKNNPDKIIAWAKREIKEYKNLIKLLED